MQPRVIRYSDALEYCGMGKTLFNSSIRPLIEVEIQYGQNFVAYDRRDLDEAIDEFKRQYGKSKGATTNLKQIQELITCQKIHRIAIR